MQAGETELGVWGAQVVAVFPGELEELGGHDRTHGVHAHVAAIGLAASVAGVAGEGIGAAGLELGPENILRHDLI